MPPAQTHSEMADWLLDEQSVTLRKAPVAISVIRLFERSIKIGDPLFSVTKFKFRKASAGTTVNRLFASDLNGGN